MNIRTFLEERAAQHGDKVAVVIGDQPYSYADINRRVDQAANLLLELGVGRGDKVAVMLPNCLEFLLFWFGTVKIGAVVVPVNSYLRGDGLRYVLQHSDAVLQVIAAEVEAEASRVDDGATPRLVRGHGLEQRLATAPLTAPPTVAVDPGDVCAILYTSGTTGRSKGVMLSHFAYLNTAREMADAVKATEHDVFMTPLPLFHAGAQFMMIMTSFTARATVVVLDRFSASTYWETVRRHKATILHSLGTLISMLFKQPERPEDREHSATRMIVAACPSKIWQPFQERFGVQIAEGYGLTESGALVAYLRLDAPRVGSAGFAPSYADVWIADPENGERLPPETVGEIVMRPHTAHAIMEGYYKDAEATSRSLRDGVLHTGDMGRTDADGYLYFVDRLKDSIRRRGENIASFEVEEAVNSCPEVLESAAVGVHDELGEEEVMIVVVPNEGQQIDPIRLMQWTEGRLAYFAVPRYVKIRESLPKTPSQRVQKMLLRAEGVGDAWDRVAAGYKLKR